METLLGVSIDLELNFENHISNICSKVSRKRSALGHIAGYITLKKRRMFFKTFIESQFNYCPLIWMLHSQTMNDKINRLHKRSLRTVYYDESSTFEVLLERDKTFSIHHKNIQSWAIEIYNFVNGLSAANNEQRVSFKIKRPAQSEKCKWALQTQPKNTKISYLAPKIWSIVPQTIKESTSINKDKRKQKQRNGNQIAHAGFARDICNMLVLYTVVTTFSVWQSFSQKVH